jgi:hypothetical protein
MAGDREARVLAAGEKIEVEGKEYTLRPITVQHLCDLEREALKEYKRNYLRTFSDNADLLGDGKADILLEREMVKVAQWAVNDLPQRFAYDVSHVPLTDEIKSWVKEVYGELSDTDRGILAMLSTGLDEGKIKMEEVKKMTGSLPRRGRVRYDQWWITASFGGMVSFIYSSLRRAHPDMSKDDVEQWPLVSIIEAARIVESISSAALGNM